MKKHKTMRYPVRPEVVMLGSLPKGVTVNIPEVKVRNYKSTAKPMEVADNPTVRQMADFMRTKVLVKGEITTQEFGIVLFLNRRNKVIGYWKQAMGAIAQVTFEQRLIFSAAMQTLSSSIVLCHNHPSGSLDPSHQDKVMTDIFVKMGEILGILVLDHIIITESGYFSFLENKMIPNGLAGEPMAGFDGDPATALRREIRHHLQGCDGSRTPKVCSRASTEQGYLQLEELIIGMCLGDGCSIQTAIVNLESDVL